MIFWISRCVARKMEKLLKKAYTKPDIKTCDAARPSNPWTLANRIN
jgi:hypothetical protein